MVTAAIVMAACSGEGSSPTTTVDPDMPRRGGILTMAVPPSPVSWSPAGEAWTTGQLQMARAVYDRLMVRDDTDRPTPELLESIEADEGFTEWTLRLRPDLRFHDGSPLDSVALAANLDAQRLSSSSGRILSPLVSVLAVDERTVTVLTSSPFSTFPEVLTGQAGFVAAPSVLAFGADQPIGTGPFRYDAQAEGAIVMSRNDSYWRPGLPLLDQVRFVTIAEASERVDAVATGAVDLAAVDEPRQVARLDSLTAQAPVEVVEDRNSERPKVAIALNTGRPPFDRISARRAVALATDRQAILDTAFDGQGQISRGVISDTSPWFSDRSGVGRDVDRARQQAAQFTEETGLPLVVEMVVPPDPTLNRVASLWRLQMEEAGIAVTIVPVDARWLEVVTRLGQFQSAITVGFDRPHPDAYLPQFFGVPGEQPFDSVNITRYANSLVSNALIDARATADLTRQVDAYGILQEQLSVDLPWLFLVEVREVLFASTNLRDLVEWQSASGSSALGLDDATVSLTHVWRAS